MIGNRPIDLYRESLDPIFTRKFYEEGVEKKADEVSPIPTGDQYLATVMQAKQQLAEQIASQVYDDLPRDQFPKTLKKQYVDYFLHCYAPILGLQQIANFHFAADEEKASAFFSACIKKLPLEFTLKNILSQLLKKPTQIPEEQEKMLEFMLMHRLFETGCLDPQSRIEILLNSGDTLYLLLDENHIKSSYVKEKSGDCTSFSAYYEKLSEAQQEEIRNILVKRAEESPYQKEQRAILLLGQAVDKVVKDKGDFTLAFIKAELISATKPHNNGITAIMLGAIQGYTNLVAYLGKEVRETLDQQREKDGLGAVHMAIAYGHTHIARYLVDECGAQVTLRDKVGNTPLAYAVDFERLDAVTWLLTKNNISSYDLGLDQAARIAYKKGLFTCAHSLLVAGADAPSNYETLQSVQSDKYQREKLAVLRSAPHYPALKEKQTAYPACYYQNLKPRILDAYPATDTLPEDRQATIKRREELQTELQELNVLRAAAQQITQEIDSGYINNAKNVWGDYFKQVKDLIQDAVIPQMYALFEKDKSANSAILFLIEQCRNALNGFKPQPTHSSRLFTAKTSPKKQVERTLSSVEMQINARVHQHDSPVKDQAKKKGYGKTLAMTSH